ncbi:MAG: phospholipid transport system substrate-binding protein [Lysobacterales bacterium]|jgi:phospholipid transport system substrate-binding protein
MTYSSFIKTSVLTIAITCLGSHTAIASELPGEFIVRSIEESLQILKDPELQDLDKAMERRDKLWALLEPIFNFEQIAKRSLGHHWKTRTVEEREDFILIFTQTLKDRYLSKIDSYSGEQLLYVKEKTQGRRTKVQTELILTDGKKVSINFNMLQSSATWRIYDIIIEGVSTVGNYRSQFNSILSKSSFAELLEKLNES